MVVIAVVDDSVVSIAVNDIRMVYSVELLCDVKLVRNGED